MVVLREEPGRESGDGCGGVPTLQVMSRIEVEGGRGEVSAGGVEGFLLFSAKYRLDLELEDLVGGSGWGESEGSGSRTRDSNLRRDSFGSAAMGTLSSNLTRKCEESWIGKGRTLSVVPGQHHFNEELTVMIESPGTICHSLHHWIIGLFLVP